MTAEERIKKVESSIEKWVKVTTMKAVETFRASKELHDEKVEFAFDAYVTG